MSPQPLRVGFAGLAHSHPAVDAANVRARGAEVVAVFDDDMRAADDFAERFGGASVPSVDALLSSAPDLVIATPRTDRAAGLVRSLRGAGAPVFVNKVVAATRRQLADWTGVLAAGHADRVGTSSVLRFAPALAALRDRLDGAEILGIRVRAQHDAAGFRTLQRRWQDDPALGGGILATVGVHAWEMVDVVLPGARVIGGSGWTRGAGRDHSEDAAGIDVRMRADEAEVPVQVSLSGVSGPDAYGIEVVTAGGLLSVELAGEPSNIALGFDGMIAALLEAAAEGRVVAPWPDARVVVENTIAAAEIARRDEGRTVR